MKRHGTAWVILAVIGSLIFLCAVVYSSVSDVYESKGPSGQDVEPSITTTSEDPADDNLGDLNIGGDNDLNNRAHAKSDDEDQGSQQSQESPGRLYQASQPTGKTLGNSGLAPGTKIIVVTDRSNGMIKFDTCTVAFSLPGKSGMPWAFTAGHCGSEGQRVYTAPVGRDFRSAYFLGTLRKVATPNYESGVGDWAGIRLSPRAKRPVAPTGIPQVLDTGSRAFGAQMCKWGSTTSYNCGMHLKDDVKTHLGNFTNGAKNVTAKLDQVKLCALPGDSGGPIFDSRAIVGILSSTSASAQDAQRKLCKGDAMAYYTPMDAVVTQIQATVPDAQLR